MKILKSTMLIATAGLLLSSCGSILPRIESTPIGNVDSTTLKVAEPDEDQMKSWAAADINKDTIPGMSVDRAYEEILQGKVGETVIVGVIDSGIDVEHEDLKEVIWVNEDEIPGNGIDDDKNGYVDDIHGWNFLGDIVEENMEYVRYVKKLGPKYKGKDASEISSENQAEYNLYQKAKAEYEKEKTQTENNLARYNQLKTEVVPAHEAFTNKLGKSDYTTEDLQSIQNPTEKEQQQIAMLSQMLAYGAPIDDLVGQFDRGIEYFKGRMDSHFNINRDFRKENLGDDPDDYSSRFYGNNDVDGPDPKKADARHGTHVAGIIAAQRNNGIGMDGVANNVEIMVVRAVPDGDEYDKDIAFAIRYAVDNGAKVINTSFGKYYSPHPEWVWDAIEYASKNDVLIVNAAGNEGHDLDTIQVYPNDQKVGASKEIGDTFITIGALNYEYGENMVASFSNYGKTSVDLFSPGVRIWSTTPLNTYEFLQGTSMASPEVAGVAAMIRSYFPKLSAAQVKQILMDSGVATSANVVLGGDKSNTDSFSNISASGKMANLYNALILADKVSRK